MSTPIQLFFILISSFFVYVEGQVTTQTYPYVQGPQYTALSESCVSFIQACPPTGPSCASEICKICTSLEITPSIEPCCAAATPTACFSNLIAGSPNTYTTPAGPLSSGVTSYAPGAVSCGSVYSMINSCEAATPDFTDLVFSQQASCICSISGSSAPQVYDAYFSTCLAYLSTADPQEYSLIGETNGSSYIRTPCEHLATDATAFPTTSLPPTPTSSGHTGSALSTSKSTGIAGRQDTEKVLVIISYIAILAPLAV